MIYAEGDKALESIRAGRRAHELESETLDFKQEGRSLDDAVKNIVDAVVCFANARGGVIIVGVTNSDSGPGAFAGTKLEPDLLRRRIYDLTSPGITVDVRPKTCEGARLLFIHVPQSPEVHGDTKGRASRRLGTDCLPMTPAQIANLRDERMGFDWSSQPAERAVDELSSEALSALRARLAHLPDHRRQMAALSTADLLRALRLVSTTGQLLKAGELLLCPPARGDQATVVYQYRATPGGEPKKIERLAPPLLLAFERAMSTIQDRQNATPLTLPGGQVLLVEDFPELAVREAVANAFLHRDYRLRGDIVIEHSPSSFVVHSPGPLVSGVTPQNILTHPSRPRNPCLAHAFRDLAFAEEIGRGVDRMYREMIRFGHDIPRIEADSDHVRVVFVGGAPNAQIARWVAQLPEEEREDTDTMLVVFSLCRKETTDASRLAPLLQKSEDEAEAVLRRLAEEPVALLEPTRYSVRRRSRAYRLRAAVLKGLGTAIPYHRRTQDDTDRKVLAHVSEYGRITNKTVQNLFDVDMQRARALLSDLVRRGVLVKTSARQRGPGIEYGPGPEFH